MTANELGFPGWARWTAWGLSAALVVAFGVRVASASGDGPSEDDVAGAGQVGAGLDRLDSLTYGTWAQHSAGAYLDYLANTVKVTPCLAAEGERFGYPFIDPYAGRPDDAGLGSTWAEPLMSTASSERALASAQYRWQADRLSDGNPDTNWDDQTASYQHAYSKCRHLRENDPGHPSDYLAIPSELAALVGSAEDEFGASSEYDDCMLGAGYDVYWDDFGGTDAMHAMIEAKAPSLDVSPAKLVATDEWAEFLDFEQEVLHADYECRAEKYVSLMAKLDGPVAEFERTRADDIDRLAAEWNAIAAKAERLGWTPADA